MDTGNNQEISHKTEFLKKELENVKKPVIQSLIGLDHGSWRTGCDSKRLSRIVDKVI
jgi:hypothetical protein